MPLIDTPFKKVAVDIVGPIALPSEARHRYGLTLVDYATKDPKAVPLKKITTEAVAEALLDIYSRVGIPEEVLTDERDSVYIQKHAGSIKTTWHKRCHQYAIPPHL